MGWMTTILDGKRFRGCAVISIVLCAMAYAAYAISLQTYTIPDNGTGYEISTHVSSGGPRLLLIYIDGNLVCRYFDLFGFMSGRGGPGFKLDMSYSGHHVLEVRDPFIGLKWTRDVFFDPNTPFMEIREIQEMRNPDELSPDVLIESLPEKRTDFA